MKIFSVNITKHVQDVYVENLPMKMKEVKENLNQWTDTACGWFGRFNIAETSILSEITDI